MVDLKLVTKAMGELDEEQVLSVLQEFISKKPSEKEAAEVIQACQAGMGLVGEKYEKGDYFVGDLIFAGELLTQVVDILKPVLGGSGEKKTGKIVLGTVQGDLHDIGKNIFKSMAEAAGFEVYDLGVDQPVESFVKKVKEVNPDIVGMSGLLTLAKESMKHTVEGLKNAGIRDGIRIIIGGNLVTKETCEYVGADAYTTNAAEGVRICQGWVK